MICPAGYGSVTTLCQPCPLGTFSGGGLRAQCTPAPVGSFVGVEGSSSYLPCAAAVFEGASCCGLFADNRSNVVSEGYFRPFPDVGMTYMCPPGSFSVPNSVSCTSCSDSWDVAAAGSLFDYLCMRSKIGASGLIQNAINTTDDILSSSGNPSHGSNDILVAAGIGLAASIFLLILFALVMYGIAKEKRNSLYKDLPLHIAIIDNIPISQAFFDEHLGTANLRDPDECSVIDLILERMPGYNILYENWFRLVIQSLPVDLSSGADVDPSVHNYAWCKLVQRDDPASTYVLKRVLELAGEHVDKLLYARDVKDRHAVDIASPVCKDMLRRTRYLHGCYEIKDGAPDFKSDTTIIQTVIYHPRGSGVTRSSSLTQRVALKFMKERWQFLKETGIREICADHGSECGILTLKKSFDGDKDTEENKTFRRDAIKRGYADYPFCIVTDAFDCHLYEYSDRHRTANTSWEDVRRIMKSLFKTIGQLHDSHIVHGDIKPTNIAFIGSRIFVTGMDSAVTFSKDCPQFVGGKYSSAYVPPEFIHLRFGSAVARVYRGDPMDHTPDQITATKKYDYDYLLADPSFDMWSLGCVLYYLCTGTTLFKTSFGDNTNQKELFVLAHWTNTLKQEKLAAITDELAANLLSILLEPDPLRRTNCSLAMSHPFVTGRKPTRLPGTKPAYDIFLSYRVASDSDVAVSLFEELNDAGYKVWFDKVCLTPGQVWEVEFCEGLVNSACFVCLVSRKAVNHTDSKRHSFVRLDPTSSCDNVLLEWRLALELKARNMIEAIYPVVIGDVVDSEDGASCYTNYFESGCHPMELPNIQVNDLEVKLKEHLDRHSLGAPMDKDATVSQIVGNIFAHGHASFHGEASEALIRVVDHISDMADKAADAAELAAQIEREKQRMVSMKMGQSPRAVGPSPDRETRTASRKSEESLLPLLPELTLSASPPMAPRRDLSARCRSSKSLTSSPRDDTDKRELREKLLHLSVSLTECDEQIGEMNERIQQCERMLAEGKTSGLREQEGHQYHEDGVAEHPIGSDIV
jgi:serine/threonine protein kinase